MAQRASLARALARIPQVLPLQGIAGCDLAAGTGKVQPDLRGHSLSR